MVLPHGPRNYSKRVVQSVRYVRFWWNVWVPRAVLRDRFMGFLFDGACTLASVVDGDPQPGALFVDGAYHRTCLLTGDPDICD